jgi:uncharacterized membrane protein (UPF0127 family)
MVTRPASILVSVLILAGCGGSAPPVETLPTGVLHIETSSGEVLVEVSIAETSESRQQGLMGVEEMGEDTGMVFLEEQPVQQAFWMKDTLIPLSIAFWDQDGRIQAILDMEPCREDPCELYDPGVAWIGAVEVNQGFLADHGVEVGDSVTLERT